MRSLTIVAAVMALALGGCGNGTSAVETRDRSGEEGGSAQTGGGSSASERSTVEPQPALTANRRETVDAKTERLFARNGAAFGAKTAEEYLDKVRAFTKSPPRDVDRVERPNGDVLIYQASTNTFAVVARDGTPKTMFKPDDGATYWAEQKAAAPTFGRRRDASGAGE